MIRILLVDNHPIVRRALKDILTRDLAPVFCGEAANAEEALSQVQSHHWALVILDVTIAVSQNNVSVQSRPWQLSHLT